MGYGAMQLAGPHVFGPPADHDGALAILREVVRLGIIHIDASDFYGPHITNQLIKEALRPYPEQLRFVTKVGALRDVDGNWPKALAPDQLRQAVHDNLASLGLDRLDVVNLRVGGLDAPEPGSIAEPFSVLAEMQQEGLIKRFDCQRVQQRPETDDFAILGLARTSAAKASASRVRSRASICFKVTFPGAELDSIRLTKCDVK